LKRFSVLFASCLLAGLVLAACGPENNPTATPTPGPVRGEAKIDTVLLGLVIRYATTEGSNDQKLKTATEYARANNMIGAGDKVSFELELDGPSSQKPVTDKVAAMGGTVADAVNIEGTVKLLVRVPVQTLLTYANSATRDDFLRDLADFKGVVAIRLLYNAAPSGLENLPETLEALQQVGFAARNEGVKVMGVDKWHAAGFRGKGIKVGVIDSGFKFYKDLRGTYLPENFEPVDIAAQLGETPRLEYEVHGTGTAEIIYSLAPEATIIAAAMSGDDFQLTRAIDYMVEQGAQIVSMSVRRNITSMDGNGAIDKKIEKLRQEKGIMFIASAGNEAQAHYTAYFDPSPDGFHQFVPGVTRMAVALPSYAAPYNTPIVLNWENWYDKDKLDLDLFAESEDGKPLYSSQIYQSAREPLEWLPARFQPGQTMYLKIRQKPNTPAPKKPIRLHLFTYRIQFQFYVPQLAVGDPASSRGVLATGAVEHSSDRLAVYSSNGPLVNGVFKPEISGPTNVSSASFQQEGMATFGGTSASCPEVSGLATVLLGANPTFTPDQLTRLLLENAKDLGISGPDLAYGYGRAFAGPPPGDAPRTQLALAPSPTANTNPNITVQVYPGYKTPVVTPMSPSTFKPTPVPTPTAAPSPTATPLPSPTPLPTPQPLVADYRDDFKSAQSGLPNAGPLSYRDGQYAVKAAPNTLAWGIYPPGSLQVESFAAEVSAEGIREAGGLYGLVFWFRDPSDYFLLAVTWDGMAQVGRFQNGNWQELLPWRKVANWQSGGANLLRLVAGDGQVMVYVNNRAITPQPVAANSAGGFGFAAGSYSGEVEALYRNFQMSFNINRPPG
jgi:subtilisin family serine protease